MASGSKARKNGILDTKKAAKRAKEDGNGSKEEENGILDTKKDEKRAKKG